MGDSITDGRGSTTNGNDRWPDVLASRLQADPTKRTSPSSTSGSAGSIIIRSGGVSAQAAITASTARFLGQSGVKWVVVLEGVNDIGGGTSASEDHAAPTRRGDRQGPRGRSPASTASRSCHSRAARYAQGDNEDDRTDVNAFIRARAATSTPSIDLEAASEATERIRPPSRPTWIIRTTTCLNPTGLAALANAIDLSLFTPWSTGTRAASTGVRYFFFLSSSSSRFAAGPTPSFLARAAPSRARPSPSSCRSHGGACRG